MLHCKCCSQGSPLSWKTHVSWCTTYKLKLPTNQLEVKKPSGREAKTESSWDGHEWSESAGCLYVPDWFFLRVFRKNSCNNYRSHLQVWRFCFAVASPLAEHLLWVQSLGLFCYDEEDDGALISQHSDRQHLKWTPGPVFISKNQ